MPPPPPSLLAFAVLIIAVPSVARADGEKDNPVEAHDFATASGQDTAMARRSTSVTYLNPGPLVSLVGGRQPATGWGAEVGVMHYALGTWSSFGVGGFAQAQLYNGRYTRFALGAQACFANVGAELGFAYRAGDSTYTDTVSVHAALFLSVAFVTFAIRDAVPLNGYGDGVTSKMGFGSEIAFTMALKVPIIVQGRDPAGFSILGGS